jgi:hypothetical protein
MPRRSEIEQHKHRVEIEILIINDVRIAHIAGQFGLSPLKIWRHKQKLLKKPPQYIERLRASQPTLAEIARLHSEAMAGIEALERAQATLQKLVNS